MHDYLPTKKGGINQDLHIFAVPGADDEIEYVVANNILRI